MQVDGYSLDAQKEKLKRYAEFQRMLNNIENGKDEVQFVLVFKLSRFTFIGILIYDFHVLKFRISFEFFFLSI